MRTLSILFVILALSTACSNCSKEDPQIEDMVTDEVSRQLEDRLSDIESYISDLEDRIEKLETKQKNLKK